MSPSASISSCLLDCWQSIIFHRANSSFCNSSQLSSKHSVLSVKISWAQPVSLSLAHHLFTSAFPSLIAPSLYSNPSHPPILASSFEHQGPANGSSLTGQAVHSPQRPLSLLFFLFAKWGTGGKVDFFSPNESWPISIHCLKFICGTNLFCYFLICIVSREKGLLVNSKRRTKLLSSLPQDKMKWVKLQSTPS